MSAVTHPASEGLRLLADQLDRMVCEDGITLNVKAEFQFTKADFSIACRRLDMVTRPIKDEDLFVNATGKVGELTISGYAWRREMCVKKTVMKAVEVWVCGDEDMSVQP